MRYQGGKHNAAPFIVSAIEAHTPTRSVIEPFCGGCSVTAALCRAGFTVEASDINASLILLWQRSLEGDIEPFGVTEESYVAWKNTPHDSWERAIVGFGGSFGAKWFGGMARNEIGHDFIGSAVRSINKKAAVMRGRTQFTLRRYQDIAPTKDAVYYLDPLYCGTTKHFGGAFDSEAFWRWAQGRAQNNAVFVSEYNAPCGKIVMERETPLSLGAGRNGPMRTQTERLFLL